MINNVVLVGKLLNEPVLRETKKGVKVCNLTLLTWKFVPVKDDTEGDTPKVNKIKTKHMITCWGNRAVKAVNILKKGMLVYVDGELVRRVTEKKIGDEIVHIPFVEIKADLIKRIKDDSNQYYLNRND